MIKTRSQWIILVGRGFPLRSNDDEMNVLVFDDEGEAQQYADSLSPKTTPCIAKLHPHSKKETS